MEKVVSLKYSSCHAVDIKVTISCLLIILGLCNTFFYTDKKKNPKARRRKSPSKKPRSGFRFDKQKLNSDFSTPQRTGSVKRSASVGKDEGNAIKQVLLRDVANCKIVGSFLFLVFLH